ncbi:MAG TPA: DUF4440 domain-containing protein [Gammaproteobacteria bacterium]|nr:DUF4440 domain-containing protein [Gammaproteobacteria bacterium]
MKNATVISLLALAVSTQVSAAVADDGMTEIGAQEQAQWTAAFGKGDAQEMAGLYTDDAIIKPPREIGTRVMKPAIAKYWATALKSGPVEYQVNIVAGQQQGDELYLSGYWSAVPRGAGHSPVGGSIVRVLEKQPDGSWKIALENWY